MLSAEPLNPPPPAVFHRGIAISGHGQRCGHSGTFAPYVPRGPELDLLEGGALISMVGFRFLRTRVLGWSVPFHQDFEEVNRRFYVRRRRAEGS